MSRPIVKRSEVPVEDTWNLAELFESDEAWNAELEALKAFPEKIAAYQGRLGESAQMLLESWKLDDEVTVRLGRLYSYASCRSDEDTGNGDQIGGDADDQRADVGIKRIVRGNGKAHGKCINGCGHALYQQSAQSHSRLFGFFVFTANALNQHFAADIQK